MNDKQYKILAKKLIKYHEFSFNLRGKLTRQQKAAITRINNKYKKIIKNEDYLFISYAKNKNAKKIKGLGKGAKSNKGVFIKHENAKIVIDKKGKVKKKYKKLGKKQLISEQYYFIDEFDYFTFLNDPETYLYNLTKGKKINTIRMIVGNDYDGHFSYSLPSFNNYALELLNTANSKDYVQGFTYYYYK